MGFQVGWRKAGNSLFPEFEGKVNIVTNSPELTLPAVNMATA